MLENFDSFCSSNVIIAGEFNLFSSKKLECNCGDLYLKKNSVSHIIKILQTIDLCDIQRIRNRKTKSFNFRQKHFSSVIQRRLDNIYTSNSLQEIISNVDILNAFSSNYSPVFCSFIKSLKYSKGPEFWKFNNTLISKFLIRILQKK